MSSVALAKLWIIEESSTPFSSFLFILSRVRKGFLSLSHYTGGCRIVPPDFNHQNLECFLLGSMIGFHALSKTYLHANDQNCIIFVFLHPKHRRFLSFHGSPSVLLELAAPSSYSGSFGILSQYLPQQLAHTTSVTLKFNKWPSAEDSSTTCPESSLQIVPTPFSMPRSHFHMNLWLC
jgi:hypothetical protein